MREKLSFLIIGGYMKIAGKEVSKKLVIVVVVILLLAVIGSGGKNNSTGSSSKPDETPQAAATTNKTEDTSNTKKEKEPEKPKVNKKLLEGTVTNASGLANENYTDESWAAFQTALQIAQATVDDENATQDQVDSARTALTDAISALQEKPKNPEDYQVIAYEDLARDPDSYTGQDIKITGRVLQVLEGDSETTLRVATSGNYDDVVMVGFDPAILNGTRVLEDDNVTVCGTYIGIYKYQSAIGTTISVPGLYSELVTIN